MGVAKNEIYKNTLKLTEMMKKLHLLVLGACSLPGYAAAIELDVHRVWTDTAYANALVAVENNDAPKGYKGVVVKCTWTKNGRAVTQGIAVAKNLAYGDTDIIQANGPLKGATIDSASCRIKKAYPN